MPVSAEHEYSGFLEIFLWKQLPDAAEIGAMRAVRVQQNNKVSNKKLNTQQTHYEAP